MNTSLIQIDDINKMAMEKYNGGDQEYKCACGAPRVFNGHFWHCGNQLHITSNPLALNPNTVLSSPTKPDTRQIVLWKLGSLEHHVLPTKFQIDKLKEILNDVVAGKTIDIVWGPDIDVEVITIETNASHIVQIPEEKDIK